MLFGKCGEACWEISLHLDALHLASLLPCLEVWILSGGNNCTLSIYHDSPEIRAHSNVTSVHLLSRLYNCTCSLRQ